MNPAAERQATQPSGRLGVGPMRATVLPVLALYTLTIFLGAGLLFLVQPMIAKRLLPLLGGSPAVWNTCMVFFQAALLLGYAYAHGLAKWLPARRGAMVHCAVLLGSVALLGAIAVLGDSGASPVGLPPGAVPPGDRSPIPWMLAALALSVGVPFTITATGGPILQRWFSATGHRQANDPYFLYAASNAGSLIALLGYPLVVEPLFRLRTQEWVWSAGYAAFAVLVTVCAWRTFARPNAPVATRQQRRTEKPGTNPPPQHSVAPSPAQPLSALRRLRWVLLAFVPSSLLLGMTQYVSTDVAAVPLLWVIPLSIYLLTFILAFSNRQRMSPRLTGRALAVLATGLTAVMYFEDTLPFVRQASPISLLLLMHGLALFLGAMVCHGRLAADRPEPSRLTEFYLLISVGGVLGGVFNALVAPLVFNDVYEYPIAIVLACLQIPREEGVKRTRASRILDAALPLGVLGVLMSLPGLTVLIERKYNVTILGGMLLPLILIVVIATPALASIRHPKRVALVLAGAFVALAFLPAKRQVQDLKHRTFFGVYRIHTSGPWRSIIHGTTTHGIQSIPGAVYFNLGEEVADVSRLATSYYHHTGPLGDIIRFKRTVSPERGQPFDHVAVVGLGAGAVAAYALPGQTFTFYDIEPFVVQVAWDKRYFTYLADAAAPAIDPSLPPTTVKTVVGDGRLELAKEPDGQFDLIVLDAFSSDAIPVHLVTREAVEMYTRKLAPGGLLAFHVSNRYLDLPSVLGAVAQSLGMVSSFRDENQDQISEDEARLKKQPSTWVVLARTADDLVPGLIQRRVDTPPFRWMGYRPDPPDFPVWTDDYSNIVAAFLRW